MTTERKGYPFTFDMRDLRGVDDLMEYTLQYKFESAKSHHVYIVRAERYIKHAYCIKFYDCENAADKNKYSIKSGTFEVRTILYTIMNVMQHILEEDMDASFFFIGAEDDKDERGRATRRFRVYHHFAASVVSDDSFEHFRYDDLSLYILVNKRSIQDRDGYALAISGYVNELL